jgi:NtrC-family two-component system response regulator AlgB
LIIDDEPRIRDTTAVVLGTMRYESAQASSGAEALEMLASDDFDAALLDLKLGHENGLEVLVKLLQFQPRLAVVVFTAHASIETAVEAIRLGAQDYLPKPFTPDEMRQIFYRVQRVIQLEGRVAELETRLEQELPQVESDTQDHEVQKIFSMADKAASTSATVLILGESGTGKTELARRIHRSSERKTKPFIVVHCPSLSRELLESALFGHVKGAFTGATSDASGKVVMAEGGTLFLDELGELPMDLQTKLLRLMQDREYERVGDPKVKKANVRIIAATNRDLAQAVKDGSFREDLFYRLSVIVLEMPPLRKRPADIPIIAQHLLRQLNAQMRKRVKGFSPETMQTFRRYNWPGNIRELRNVIERAVILTSGDQIQTADVPDSISNAETPNSGLGSFISLDQIEREHIRQIMAKSSSLDEASKLLGIDAATLYRKRKKYGLD